MSYNLYPEQGGVTATIQDATFTGTPTFAKSVGHIIRPGPGLYSPFPAQTASTTATIHINDRTYYSYLGRVNGAKTTCTVVYNLKTTLAATVVYAEMAIYVGAPVAGAAATLLTLAGYIDGNTSGQFLHAPGVLTATIALTGVVGGSDLWLATASSTSGQVGEFEALIIDRWATGLHLVSSASAQPSVTTTIAAASLAVNSTVAGPAAYVFI